MDITPLFSQGQQVIQSYAGGRFKVSGAAYSHALFITPEETASWAVGGSAHVDDLLPEHFEIIIDKSDEIDVILLGSGKEMAFIPPTLKALFKDVGIFVDIMDTGAACRTYNVLMAEGRRVACFLLPA